MTDERDAFSKKLSREIIGRIAKKYGFREENTDFSFVATMLLTDFMGFVMYQGLANSGWDGYCELITEEAKRRAEKARNLEIGIKQ